MARPVYGLVITCIELGPTMMEDLAAPVLRAHELMSSLHLYTDRRHEMGTIVGSREVKHVELGGGLPALAITGNAEKCSRV